MFFFKLILFVPTLYFCYIYDISAQKCITEDARGGLNFAFLSILLKTAGFTVLSERLSALSSQCSSATKAQAAGDLDVPIECKSSGHFLLLQSNNDEVRIKKSYYTLEITLNFFRYKTWVE